MTPDRWHLLAAAAVALGVSALLALAFAVVNGLWP